MKKFLREWRVEIGIVLALAFAIFLLVEQLSIRQTLRAWLGRGADTASALLVSLIQGLLSISLSDLTGLVIILIVLWLARSRLRWRLMRAPSLAASNGCPQCGSRLHRVHRKSLDYAVNSLVAPVHRYLCSNQDCRWSGLRIETRKLRHKQSVQTGKSG